MKPLIILGAAIVSGLLILFASEEEKKENADPEPKKDPEKKELESKSNSTDLDSKVRELRKALRHAERDRKAHRNNQPPV